MTKQNDERARRWRALLHERGRLENANESRIVLRLSRIEIDAGQITAVVVEQSVSECQVVVEMPEWGDESWLRAIELLSRQAIFAAQMLAGDFPDRMEEVLLQAGLTLLPAADEPIYYSCTCCDLKHATLSGQYCRHVSAALEHAGEMVAEDPWLLFLLRGRMRQQVLRSLRQARGGSGDANVTTSSGAAPQIGSMENGANATGLEDRGLAQEGDLHRLEDNVHNFWGSSRALEQFRPHIGRPIADRILLRRLGVPTFSHANSEVYDTLSAVYGRVTAAALALAYSDDPPAETPDYDVRERE